MPESTGLQTEFYQLIQAAVYHADGLWGEATFDLYVKDLPPTWSWMLAAGIEPAIDAVLAMRFTDEELRWLRAQPAFSRTSQSFFDSLRNFRFHGEISALAEGTPAFPGEPLIRVTAPLVHVGLIETRLVQTLTVTCGVATRAARLVQAAGGRPVLDFGSRRCTGAEAAWHSARGAWIGGCAATTNALAASQLGIPPWVVMSDSMLAAYDQSADAYDAFHLHFPDCGHVNLPGEDTHEGVAELASIAASLRTVRLDHRDLAVASRELRRSLDRHAMKHVRILGSGSLDEAVVSKLVRDGAPIDLYGVGSALASGGRAASPSLSYRISELTRGPDPTPVTSHWSSPWPGRKQLARFADHDELCLEVEGRAVEGRGGRLLLQPVVRDGARLRAAPALTEVRASAAAQLARLPQAVRNNSAVWPVLPSDALREMAVRG
jgi:nicotinate phosphoribosyltransferase